MDRRVPLYMGVGVHTRVGMYGRVVMYMGVGMQMCVGMDMCTPLVRCTNARRISPRAYPASSVNSCHLRKPLPSSRLAMSPKVRR